MSEKFHELLREPSMQVGVLVLLIASIILAVKVVKGVVKITLWACATAAALYIAYHFFR